MENREIAQEFEILGHKVTFRPEVQGTPVEASKVVALVRKELDDLAMKYPQLSQEQLALLACLKVAADKISLENGLKLEVQALKFSALDALELLKQ